MTSRTGFLAVLAVLTLVGGAAAQTAATESANDTTTQPPPEDRSYSLRVEPSELWLRAGQQGHFGIGASGNATQTLRARLADAPSALSVRLASDTLATGPDAWRTRVEVVVAAPEGIARADHAIVVDIVSADGATRQVKLLVHAVGEPSRPPPRAEPERAAFELRADPELRRTLGDERVEFGIYAAAKRNATITLRIAESPFEARIVDETLTIGPGQRARTALVAFVPANATSGVIVVTAHDDAGARAGLRLYVKVAAPERPAERPSDRPEEPRNATPRDEPRPERPAARPLPTAEPMPDEPAVDTLTLQLMPHRAHVLPFGGRVALLIEGGAADATLKIAPRYDAASGWRVLARQQITVPAHGHVWTWIYLQPGLDAAPLKYAIVATSADGATTSVTGAAAVVDVRIA